jgi:hypothetical protein
MRRICPVMAVLAVTLVACEPGPPPPASQYRQAEIVPPLAISFAPGDMHLPETVKWDLRQLGRSLPVQTVPALHESDAGPLAARRAQEVARQLTRPVQLVVVTDMPADQTVLVVTNSGIVADACRGGGVRELGTMWPGNDAIAPVLLPPGCATAQDIAVQTTRPEDLLQGRPLPPGAATPYAAAIERYYHRNDAPQSNAQQSNAAQSNAAQSNAAQGGAPVGPSGSAEGPSSTPGVLVGPLPSGGQGSQ